MGQDATLAVCPAIFGGVSAVARRNSDRAACGVEVTWGEVSAGCVRP